MASYHLAATIIGRSSGKSAIGAAAYRAGALLTCAETGEVFDYRRKRGVEAAFIVAPEGAPSWATDRQALWSAVQAKETRKNSQLARELILALPHELTATESADLVLEWVRAQLVGEGMIADVAIHDPKPRNDADPRNRHAHVLVTTRELDPSQPDGWAKNKNRAWNGTEALERWRETWAAAQNDAFAERGLTTRVDHRTLDAQRAEAEAAGDEIAALVLSRPPEPRLGVVAGSLETKGIPTERGEALREARQDRALLEQLATSARSIAVQIEATELELTSVEAEVVQTPAPAEAPAADARDLTRIAIDRHLRGLGLDQVEISIAGGDRPSVRLMTPAQILEDLPRLKRANQAGHSIFVRGPRDRDHDVILLDDISAFTSKALERDGLKPAVVVETSPGNYQAWFRLGEPTPAELRGEVARILAERYGGDTAAADGHQSGRLAGFTNPKPEHKNSRGRSPFALLHSYAGKAITAVRELLDAARAALALRKAAIAAAAEVTAAPEADSDLVAWWCQGHAAAPAGSNLSEVDWHLTHLALGSGRSPEDVAAALEVTAHRKGTHAHDYAITTVQKAVADRNPAPDDDGPSFG